MKRIIIRHGFTGVKRDDRDAYGLAGPPLNDLGQKQAAKLVYKLKELGIDTGSEPVAVSELLRTQHTAKAAGFQIINVYAHLNEVKTGLPTGAVSEMLAKRQVPDEAIRRAKLVLENPPEERVWIIHGLLIVGLYAALGKEREQFVPDFGELSLLNI